jgi:hypothetical protein
MPVISRFYGIVVSMSHSDDGPPHFRARYWECEAIVGIDPILILRGDLPARVVGMVVEWAMQHQTQLLEDWRLAQSKSALLPIEPLN